jgi:ankyrin repeat protein
VVHIAAAWNKVKFIKELLTRVPELRFDRKNNNGVAPIHEAAENGSAEAVEFLLKYNPASAYFRNSDSNLPIHIAVQYGKLDCVKILFTKQTMDQGGQNNETPLLQSVINEHMSVLKFLVEKGADMDKCADNGLTPLHQAAGVGGLEYVKVLLDRGAIPDQLTTIGHTALTEAIVYGSKAVVTQLLAAGANPLVRSPINGLTPFMDAVSVSRLDIVDVFLEWGSDGSELRNNTGYTCPLLAAGNGDIALLKKLLEKKPSLAQDTNLCIGDNLMLSAAWGGWFRTIPYLRELGIPVVGFHSHTQSFTPLMVSAWIGYQAFTKSLIHHGANIEESSKCLYNRTALHWATSEGNVESAMALLEGGADLRKQDGLGYSSLDYLHEKLELWDFDSMVPWIGEYSPPDHSERQPLIPSKIVEASSALLTIPNSYAEVPERKAELQYANRSIITRLEFCLRKYGSAESCEDAMVCNAPIQNPPESALFTWTDHCSACASPLQRVCAYRCCSCADRWICQECYKEYLDREQDGGKLRPTNFEVLWKLEEEVQRVRTVCEPIRQDGWLLAESFGAGDDIREWASTKLNEYEDWSKNHNKTGRFKTENFPGWSFLEILVELQRQRNRLQESGMRDREAFENIMHKLLKHYMEEDAGEEAYRFICQGHKFQEISGFLKLPNKIRENLDKDWYLSANFLRDLCDRYAPTCTTLTSDNCTQDSEILGETSTKQTADGYALDQNSLTKPVVASGNGSSGDKDSNSAQEYFHAMPANLRVSPLLSSMLPANTMARRSTTEMCQE